MSIISPFPQSTIIRLYKNVPWGMDNKDIRWFSTAAQRDVYLNARYMNQWNNCSIVKNGQTIKLTGQINDYLVANYMEFTNYGAGETGNEKSFFAFITSVDYVNINTFAVSYQIDWIQTYLFDFTFGACLVEREHVNDDTFGKYLVDEHIAISDYVITEILKEKYDKGYVAYFLSDVATSVDVQSKNGMLIATDMTANRYNVYGDLELFLKQLNSNGESNKVVSLTMCAMPLGEVSDLTDPDYTQTFGLQDDHVTFSDGITTYVAKNKKMGIYPYKLFTVDNFNGSVQEFKWENFTGNPAFKMDGVMHPRPCLECYPTNYLKWWGEVFETRNFSVEYTNFPQIAWTSDTFRAWLAQNGTAMTWDNMGKRVGVVGGTLTGIVGGMSLNPSAVASGLNTVMSSVSGLESNQATEKFHETHGSQLGGALEACGMDYLHNDIGFRVIEYCIKPEVAKRIDEFFTRYGYAVDEVKVPNINGRQKVNYVKTNGCHVDGDIPVDAKDAMENAMNSGVSFWHIDDMDTKLTSNPIV